MGPVSPAWQVATITPPVVPVRARSDRRVERRVKRALDVTVAALLLAILALPLLGLMAVVRLHDGGPALFGQIRVGRNGRRFRMWKLRTMVVDAEARKPALEPRNEVAGSAFKMRDDPRITWLGRTLRRTSLDELPQLVNVLRGEMSLVGPRPALCEEVARYHPRERRRLSVPPGMTGLWQVSGRSALPFRQWMALDLSYVDHWTLARDLSILVRTVPAVVRGTGAW